MKQDKGFEQLGDLLADKPKSKKPPAYQWQELALTVIEDLGVPGFKRSSVFKVCKENPKAVIMTALNDTKELCPAGERWKYFFKIVDES